MHSKNFDDAPVLGGIWGVLPCFMLNLFTVILLIDTIFQSSIGNNKIFTTGKYVFAGILVASLLLYYRRGGRWKRIIANYEDKENKRKENIHPIIVLVAAYVFSSAFLLLSAMYKNGDGIFK